MTRAARKEILPRSRSCSDPALCTTRATFTCTRPSDPARFTSTSPSSCTARIRFTTRSGTATRRASTRRASTSSCCDRKSRSRGTSKGRAKGKTSPTNNLKRNGPPRWPNRRLWPRPRRRRTPRRRLPSTPSSRLRTPPPTPARLTLPSPPANSSRPALRSPRGTPSSPSAERPARRTRRMNPPSPRPDASRWRPSWSVSTPPSRSAATASTASSSAIGISYRAGAGTRAGRRIRFRLWIPSRTAPSCGRTCSLTPRPSTTSPGSRRCSKPSGGRFRPPPRLRARAIRWRRTWRRCPTLAKARPR